MSRPRKLALDKDLALEDGQWTKLVTFLKPLLSAEDLESVENICRGGGDAPDDPASGASDAVRGHAIERAG